MSVATTRLRFACVAPLKYGANAAAQFDNSDWPRFVRITDITEDGWLKEETFRSLPPEEAQPYLLQEGDLLLARSGSVGRSFLYRQNWGQVCHAGYLIRARLKSDFDARFVYWSLNTSAYWAWIESVAIRSTIQNVSAEKYADFAVPSPPFETQQRIAAFLDEKTAQIDGLIEKKRALLERLAEKQQAIITQAVTKGLDPAAPMKDSGIEWLGSIPAHWEAVMTKYLITVATSGPRGWSEMTMDTGAVFFRSQNIGRSMEVVFDDLVRVQPEDDAESQRSRLKDEDVVICITGARTGAVAHISGLEHAYINQHVCLLRPSSDMVAGRYLAYSLASRLGQEQLSVAMYGLKQGLGLEQVRSLSVICPSIEEQERIVEFLDDATAMIETLTTATGQTIELLKEYRSALITAAVTGQIEEFH